MLLSTDIEPPSAQMWEFYQRLDVGMRLISNPFSLEAPEPLSP
jgi:hypothetical protein